MQHRASLGKIFWLRLPPCLGISQTGFVHFLPNLEPHSTPTRDHFRGTWFIESLSKVNKICLIIEKYFFWRFWTKFDWEGFILTGDHESCEGHLASRYARPGQISCLIKITYPCHLCLPCHPCFSCHSCLPYHPCHPFSSTWNFWGRSHEKNHPICLNLWNSRSAWSWRNMRARMEESRVLAMT